MCSTAEGGYLECLKYLHENGCVWDEWACQQRLKVAVSEILARERVCVGRECV